MYSQRGIQHIRNAFIIIIMFTFYTHTTLPVYLPLKVVDYMGRGVGLSVHHILPLNYTYIQFLRAQLCPVVWPHNIHQQL